MKIELKNISKSFGNVVALDDVSSKILPVRHNKTSKQSIDPLMDFFEIKKFAICNANIS